MSLSNQTLLVANRGEIAVRVLKTARKLGLRTLAIYTPPDATAPHVALADEAHALPDVLSYLNAKLIIDVCKKNGVTMVHPGYGFLSENEEFARLAREAGVTFLGPSPEVIEKMGLKHEARILAKAADVPTVPGSEGLLSSVDDALDICQKVGWPVMLKSTAGGGGMGLVVCRNEAELREKFQDTQERAQSLFHNAGVFLERYYPSSRHIEVQVFGDGHGHAIHIGERECSVQRRHQKVIEETPSPFLVHHSGQREKMCKAAVRLCEAIKYSSAGTVEFLVDDTTGNFFFLEMNTRLQVEHPVTEAVHPGLDLVELMIRQGLQERESNGSSGLSHDVLLQARYENPAQDLHAIEARVYSENPAAGFKPCPGVLQLVDIPKKEWVRVETWVETGTTISPNYDPLVCKLVVSGKDRMEAIGRLSEVLTEGKIYGPPNNMEYLRAICASEPFQAGKATTTFLDTFSFEPRAIQVISGGVETTIQDYPGRLTGLGIPRSGPMDSIAFRAANFLAGNPPVMEALELTLGGCTLHFCVAAVISVCGTPITLTVDGEKKGMWTRVKVPKGARVKVGMAQTTGMRCYLAVRGGFPEVPEYLGSKSTSMGLGGYQGRSLTSGDQLALGACEPTASDDPDLELPQSAIPEYPPAWEIGCLSGPHDDEAFVSADGIEQFYSSEWKISASSNRMGIRLEGPKIQWARKNGGEGGSHPSNIHDNGYALGSVNINGDTPVILTKEGPDMGGYMCFCTVATTEQWKLGQLRPGCTVRFKRISHADALKSWDAVDRWNEKLYHGDDDPPSSWPLLHSVIASIPEARSSPVLHVIPATAPGQPRVVFRQAGDCAILVEYGDLLLDFALRARIHALEAQVREAGIKGIRSFCPCIRSTMVHYDPHTVTQDHLLTALIKAEQSLPTSFSELRFPARKYTLPIVLDDRWNQEALGRYMRSIRDKAVYLPSNIEYLAKNNGLSGGAQQALKLLVETDWLVFGVGFYLACPFLVPVDPRCRLVGQKMNPSRTYTPRGAIGIAGLVAAIYPVESPGGYQLYGRTLPAWQTWGKGGNFDPSRPWLLSPFDQVRFTPVTEEEYIEIERQFDAGRYSFHVEDAVFSMAEYNGFVDSIADEIAEYKECQARAVEEQEARETELLAEWEEQQRRATTSDSAAAGNEGVMEGSAVVSSPMSASVWKIRCKVGDVIRSAEEVVVVLEAMKTEVSVEAGDEAVGKTIKGFGSAAKEGAQVSAGDVLVVLA